MIQDLRILPRISEGPGLRGRSRQINYAILWRMSVIIAVDIGGTQIRAAAYPKSHIHPSVLDRIATQDEHATPVERLIQLIESIWPADESVTAIGIAAPGPLDPYDGIIIAAPNIAGWSDLPLRKTVEDHFKVPVILGNDANLAAYGEWCYGAGQSHHHLIYLTVSTGIGGGVIIDDRLLLGQRGLAAELGHVTIQLEGPLCGCGQRGHLEALASGTAIAEWVERELTQGAGSLLPHDQPITTKMVAQAAKQGDELAIAALARSGAFIGQALANYLHIFNPSIVIIGGGVSKSGSFLLEPIRAAMCKHVISEEYIKNLTLTTAELGDEAGLMGALALVRKTYPDKINE
jgi:glucokinase